MMPIQLDLGIFSVYVYGAIVSVGLFVALYWWWKMGRDEHWEEIELFDGYFLSLFVYLIASRLGYVVLHLSELDTLYRILAILSYPGLNGEVGVMAVMVFVVLFARRRGWQVWKALDVSVVSLALAFIFGALAHILNSNPSWLVATWMISWSLVTFAMVTRVRKNFRFYAWYKGEASVAQEGLATLMFALFGGIYYLMMGWLKPSTFNFWFIPLESLSGLILIVMSINLIYARTGRKVNLLQWWRKRG